MMNLRKKESKPSDALKKVSDKEMDEIFDKYKDGKPLSVKQSISLAERRNVASKTANKPRLK
jgi:hypothetical protein